MAIRVCIHHKTTYEYDQPAVLSPHVFRLRPAVHCRTPIQGYSLRIQPKDHFINWQQDPFGNYLARVVFNEKATVLDIEAEVIAEMIVINPFDFFMETDAEKFPFAYKEDLKKDLAPYLVLRESGPRLMKRMSRIDRTPQNTVDFLVDLNRRLCDDIEYAIRMEPGVQTCEQTLEKAGGSCRDSAWLLVQTLRHLGLAARFVSGYLVQLVPDVKSLDGPSGPERDFTDLHAWAEVYAPGAGWIGLDPTSGLFAGEGHIPLACTPEPASAAPLTGSAGRAAVNFSFSNSVTRIHEDPRVTKPYSEEAWAAIMALGRKTDEDLIKNDVRLTMGGEPTFVSIDDMEADEWNTAADGKQKRRLAGDLIRRLKKIFAQGGALHYGQGKWYPGEPLPRWRLSCFWRADGVPLWQNPDLLADETRDMGFGLKEAEAFAREMALGLGVHPDHVIPGYEDAFYALWAEGKLPDNIDPKAADLKQPDERRRLFRLLAGDLNAPAGFALPIRWSEEADAWESSPWMFKAGVMYLTPGDSPMGLRLPLDSLPWMASEKRVRPSEPSTFTGLPPLGDYSPDYSEVIPQKEGKRAEDRADSRDAPDSDEDRLAKIPHTALVFECRDGRLHVFLPPLTCLEHFLGLLSAVEAAAERLNLPVVLEGYEPPSDHRLKRLLATPDPGVIEVNVHPAASWEELTEITETLYETARTARLGAEKFMIDGRHTGTGGGNHVTLGAAEPADSPFLRRPHLLRSMITYWQHHPALSYLFSGLFIGPTSQAPRVDEGRDDRLHELEIAFDLMPKGDTDRPWLADRLLRHLLTDLTGNTHRAEFCIDKLYSPDSLSGRQGLLEFRGFEMPPHARMSLVQMLLIRCLIARFWQSPYKRRLARWGTALHDRFMLPHYVWSDMRDVVEDLNRSGYPFDLDWLAPFFEFRFPVIGTVQIRDVELELRTALEPWHVLGEEVTRQGAARFVDSSVERIQVKATGLADGRYVAACNGRRIPLRPAGANGEYVGGVRFRAWQPPSALHPTIGVHAPLVIDLVDTWNGRSVGGCTYHVAHAGGRSYDTFPVNAYEAEARRAARFWNYGHSPGPIRPKPETGGLRRFFPEGRPPEFMAAPPPEDNPEFPCTLDMRRNTTSSPTP